MAGRDGARTSAPRFAASRLLTDPGIDPAVRDRFVPTYDNRQAVLVELALEPDDDPLDVRQGFLETFDRFRDGAVGEGPPDPEPISGSYFRCLLDAAEIKQLLVLDVSADGDPSPRSIFRIWPDYILRAHIDRSVATITADAAARTFRAVGAGVVWAVIDSGIDADHPHFASGTLTDPTVARLHRDYTYLVRGEKKPTAANPAAALRDPSGHGTHVAGIIAGALPDGAEAVIVGTGPTIDGLPQWQRRHLTPGTMLAGVAAQARLVSLRVLDGDTEEPVTVSSAVITALEHVRRVNADGRRPRIHGVNLSLGCPWDPADYVAGQSPLCRELDRLVGTGVVAVVSAGNDGAGGADGDPDPHGQLATISDPGNAARAITVGSTHRDRPHAFGVSLSSSKGPTTDGRAKPDLVAPGEHITSAATGAVAAGIPAFAHPGIGAACYRDDSGTSMAAPHVSGAIAALLSVRPEYMGDPDEVKRLFTTYASSLGRHEFFQGAGLVDLMKVLTNL